MSKRQKRNVAASVRRRLLNLSVEKGEDFNLVLTRYALERLLYRLTRSQYADHFVLKGAMLFVLWSPRPHRPTRDLDLLGYGQNSREALTIMFQRICLVPVEPDGLQFDPNSVEITDIRETQEYQGQRIKLLAQLETAKISLQTDIGFGDVVTPEAVEIDYPTLLDLPAPRIRAYPPETVIAEKLQAMVALGIANTRMKDFYDLFLMARQFSFDGATIMAAIRATFARRRTAIPDHLPSSLSEEFATDKDKALQWRAFLQRNRLEDAPFEFAEAVGELRIFLLPPLFAAARNQTFRQSWANGGPWS